MNYCPKCRKYVNTISQVQKIGDQTSSVDNCEVCGITIYSTMDIFNLDKIGKEIQDLKECIEKRSLNKEYIDKKYLNGKDYNPFLESSKRYVCYLKGRESTQYLTDVIEDHQSIIQDFVYEFDDLTEHNSLTEKQCLKYCAKNNPVLYIYDTELNEETIFAYNEGYIGIQTMLDLT